MGVNTSISLLVDQLTISQSKQEIIMQLSDLQFFYLMGAIVLLTIAIITYPTLRSHEPSRRK